MTTLRSLDRLRRSALAGVIGAVALLAAGASAAADTRFGSGCTFTGRTLTDGSEPLNMSGTFCSGGVLEARGTEVVAVWTGDETLYHAFDQYALTATSGIAGLGTLGAYSQTTVTSRPMAWEFFYSNGEPGITENDSRAIADSGTSAYWFDEITVVAPPGQYVPVVLEFSLGLHTVMEVVDGGRGTTATGARLIADDDRSSINLQLNLAQSGLVSDRRGYVPGTTIRLYGDLSASTHAEAGRIYLNNGWTRDGYVAESHALANAMNTAGFHVDVVTEGASYTSASGFSYVTAVPEPGSAALWALGVAGVLLTVRRRRG